MNPIFTLGCTSLGQFANDYRRYIKRKKLSKITFCYIPSSFTQIRPADVYLIETVHVFAQVKDKLLDTSVSVIADSPLILTELPRATALDYQSPDNLRLVFKPVDFRFLEGARRRSSKNPIDNGYKDYEVDHLDKLGLVIEKTATGNILTPFNALRFQLSILQREKLDTEMALFLEGKTPSSAFKKRLSSLAGEALSIEYKSSIDALSQSLHKQGEIFKKAVILHAENKSAAKIIKENNLSAFEVRYLASIVRSHRKKDQKET